MSDLIKRIKDKIPALMLLIMTFCISTSLSAHGDHPHGQDNTAVWLLALLVVVVAIVMFNVKLSISKKI